MHPLVCQRRDLYDKKGIFFAWRLLQGGGAAGCRDGKGNLASNGSKCAIDFYQCRPSPYRGVKAKTGDRTFVETAILYFKTQPMKISAFPILLLLLTTTSLSAQDLTIPPKNYVDSVDLAQAPARTTAKYPLSDQQNTGNWKLLKKASDEFNPQYQALVPQ